MLSGRSDALPRITGLPGYSRHFRVMTPCCRCSAPATRTSPRRRPHQHYASASHHTTLAPADPVPYASPAPADATESAADDGAATIVSAPVVADTARPIVAATVVPDPSRAIVAATVVGASVIGRPIVGNGGRIFIAVCGSRVVVLHYRAVVVPVAVSVPVRRIRTGRHCRTYKPSPERGSTVAPPTAPISGATVAVASAITRKSAVSTEA